jgi:predicted ATP-grasp superfamily ATP-dependent carboligase
LKNKPLVLVLDYDISPGPGVLCTLTQTRSYSVFGVTTKPNHKAAFSLRHKIVYAPELDYACLDVEEFVRQFSDRFKGAVLLPSTSRTVKWLIQNQKELSKYWKIPALPQLEAFKIAIDKAEFVQFGHKYNIPIPVTRTLDEFLRDKGQGIAYPILIKPTNFFAGEGIRRFENFKELQHWVTRADLQGGYIVQNWLAGSELSGGFYCENGVIHTHVFYKAITRRSTYGAFHSLKFVHDEKALAVAQKIFLALNWNGVANIDFRYQIDESLPDSIPYALEVNPRPWGNFLGAAFKGVNFAQLMCQSALREPTPVQNYRVGNYFSPRDSMVALRHKWMFRSLKGHKLEEFRWRDSSLKMYIADPLTPLGYFFRSQEGSAIYKIAQFFQHFKLPTATPEIEADPQPQ